MILPRAPSTRDGSGVPWSEEPCLGCRGEPTQPENGQPGGHGSGSPGLKVIASRAQVRDNGPVVDHVLRRILVLSGDSDAQELLRLALETVGRYRVEVCDHVSALVPVAALFQPDLVVLDLQLVGEEGPRVLDDLQTVAADEAPPVVVVLAGESPPTWANQLSAGLTVVSLPRGSDPFAIPRILHALWRRFRGSPG